VNWQTHADPAAAPSPDTRSQGLEPLHGIAEACRCTGLSPRTVRYYEELGLLPGVRRRNGGRRVYGAGELQRLRFITRLKALGLSLAEIKQLNAVYAIGGSTGAMLRRLDELLGRRRGELEMRIAQLCELRDEMDRYRDRVRHRIDEGEGA
jgi:MerR family transcriptional regulator, copper efflux regulator